MTETERARVQWLLGYLKGAMIGIWALCDMQKSEVVTPEAVADMEKYVDELTELVGRMEDE